MSTVIYESGLRIWVNPKEPQHRGRPHCHIKKGDAEAEFDLVTLEVMKNNGKFSRGDVNLIRELIKMYQSALMEKWEEYHG